MAEIFCMQDNLIKINSIMLELNTKLESFEFFQN